jgi:hypothetical protein
MPETASVFTCRGGFFALFFCVKTVPVKQAADKINTNNKTVTRFITPRCKIIVQAELTEKIEDKRKILKSALIVKFPETIFTGQNIILNCRLNILFLTELKIPGVSEGMRMIGNSGESPELSRNCN